MKSERVLVTIEECVDVTEQALRAGARREAGRIEVERAMLAEQRRRSLQPRTWNATRLADTSNSAPPSVQRLRREVVRHGDLGDHQPRARAEPERRDALSALDGVRARSGSRRVCTPQRRSAPDRPARSTRSPPSPRRLPAGQPRRRAPSGSMKQGGPTARESARRPAAKPPTASPRAARARRRPAPARSTHRGWG